jgi:hypothetical protein
MWNLKISISLKFESGIVVTRDWGDAGREGWGDVGQ